MVSGGNTSSRAAPRAPRPVPGLVRETCFLLASPSLSFLICKLTPRGCDGVARASHSVYRPCCWWLEFKPLAGGVEAPCLPTALEKGFSFPLHAGKLLTVAKPRCRAWRKTALVSFLSFFFLSLFGFGFVQGLGRRVRSASPLGCAG